MKNHISVFDEEKVTISMDDDNVETAWYDITDIIGSLFEGKSSVLDYVNKDRDGYISFLFYKGIWR